MAEERLTQLRAFAARRPLIVAASCVGVAVLAVLAVRGGGEGKTEAGVRQSQVVEPTAFASTIAVVGIIVPDQNLYVTAPLAGPVKRVGFDYGAPVVRGQVLAEIDDSDARQRRDEARAAWLKAEQDWNEMAIWPNGQDVSRDRRAASSAGYDLADTRRKAIETKRLLDRGLVARDEYDAILAQQHSQELALAGARQDLAATLARGRGASREVVALQLRDAQAQLAELDREVEGAIVRAPADGVIVRPPADKDSAASQIHVGQQLSRGQLIGSIAKAGGLAVSFQLSETDANQVRPGQAVSVTGPGFGGPAILGHVVSVAGEASPGAAAGGPLASFAAGARLDRLTPVQTRAVRIGMTANVAVATYSAVNALVAPPAAIQGGAPAAFVTVRDPRTGKPRAVPVQIGHVSPDGDEVLSGLKAGDTLVWTAPAEGAAKPAG